MQITIDTARNMADSLDLNGALASHLDREAAAALIFKAFLHAESARVNALRLKAQAVGPSYLL
jgi:hypothetical protein